LPAHFNRKKRKSAISYEVRLAVQDHYRKNSRQSPRARDANFGRRKNVPATGKLYLECTLRECYKLWCNAASDNPKLQIGRRAFESMRPRNVQILGRDDRIVCACQRHVNARLLVVAFDRFRYDMAVKGVIWAHEFSTDMSDIVKLVTCQQADMTLLETDTDCVYGKCITCGVRHLDRLTEVRIHMKGLQKLTHLCRQLSLV
jgi:hypothetical protein